jgi:hypothetical protein
LRRAARRAMPELRFPQSSYMAACLAISGAIGLPT